MEIPSTHAYVSQPQSHLFDRNIQKPFTGVIAINLAQYWVFESNVSLAPNGRPYRSVIFLSIGLLNRGLSSSAPRLRPLRIHLETIPAQRAPPTCRHSPLAEEPASPSLSERGRSYTQWSSSKHSSQNAHLSFRRASQTRPAYTTSPSPHHGFARQGSRSGARRGISETLPVCSRGDSQGS